MRYRRIVFSLLASAGCLGAWAITTSALNGGHGLRGPFPAPTRAAERPKGDQLAYANIEPLRSGDPLPEAMPVDQPAGVVAPAGVAEALAAYRSGDLAAGDAAAANVDDPVARLALEWAALRLQPRLAGLDRLTRFVNQHPDWPSDEALMKRAEEILWADKKPGDVIAAFFARRPPATPLGKLALARARMAEGSTDAAALLAREVWREADLSPALETQVLKEFGDYLTWADHKHRSDRLTYKDNAAAGEMRAAGLAGPDVLALAKARENLNDKLVATMPPELRDDPTMIFARVQKLNKDGHVVEAARLMLTAPRDPEALVSPDDWWIERRQIARKLIDLGSPRLAYQLCAEHSARANDQRIDAEFHAGWIALRFLADPTRAAGHFARAAEWAETPMSSARIAYWRARAAEAAEDEEAATRYFEQAASRPTTFYGQLALARLGRSDLTMRMPARVAVGDDRGEAVRVIELLESLDARDIAAPLATDMARSESDESRVAALGETLVAARDARLALAVGKLASQRGLALDEFAFPVFGIPRYEPMAGSAPRALVYAIARQESAFDAKAISSAGARGLMQMMPATARRTAQHKGLPYDETRLLNDPAFNAMLGAAHLGELTVEHPGSLILAFAAYNAGGKRVKEWIAAHGDPRDPAVDPVDWIELIPIAETRNYVQRIAENLEVYRQRLGGATKLAIEATLRENDGRQ